MNALAKDADISGVRVELDVFSGRPNPAWDLEGSSALSVAHVLQELCFSSDGGPAVDDEKLGFRGFLVEIRANGEGRRYRVYGDFIRDLTTRRVSQNPRANTLIVSSMPAELRGRFSDVLSLREK